MYMNLQSSQVKTALNVLYNLKTYGEGRVLDLTHNSLRMEKRQKSKRKAKRKIVPRTGFEPTTNRLQVLHLTAMINLQCLCCSFMTMSRGQVLF